MRPWSVPSTSARLYGVVGDGVTDDTDALQSACDQCARTGTCLDLPPGRFRITRTLRTRARLVFRGSGWQSRIVADGIAGPAICTYGGDGDATEPGQCLSDFVVSGTATCAVAFVHCPQMTAARISLDAFTGTDGFVFEYVWGCEFDSLRTNGATLTGACVKINRTVLASTWRTCYTSNRAEHNLLVDQRVTEFSTGSASGFGRLHFDSFVAQGADVAGVRLAAFAGPITLTNLYTENVAVPAIVGNQETTSGWLDFHGCDFAGDRADSSCALMLHRVSGVNVIGGRFDDAPIIVGGVTGAVVLVNPVRVGNRDLWALIRRTADTPSSMPLTIIGGGHNEHSRLILKTTGYGWAFREMTVDATGAWQATSRSVPLVDAVA